MAKKVTESDQFWRRILGSRLMAKWDAQGSQRQRFLVGAFWSVFGAGFGQGLSLIANAIAARLLGPEKYGELGIVYSTVGMFGVLAGLGMSTTSVRYIAAYRDTDPERSGRIIGLGYLVTWGLGGLISILVYIIAPFLAHRILAAPHLVQGLRVGALLLLLSALEYVQLGLLAGFEAFSSVTVSRITHGVVLLLTLPPAVLRWGVSGGTAAMAVASGLSCLVNSVMLRRQYANHDVVVRFRQAKQELSILFQFSIPAAVSGLLVSPVVWVSNTLIVNRPQGYVAMGLFQAASQWQRAVMFLPAAFSNVLLVLLAQQRTRRSDNLEQFNILSSWIVGLVLATPLILFPELVSWIYGERYSLGLLAPTLSLVMMYTVITSYKDGLARVLAVRSLMWWGVLSNVVWGALLIGGTLLLRSWGAKGLATAYVLAYGLNTIVFVPFYVKRGLIPRKVLLSRQALFIWAVLLILCLSVVLQVSLVQRALLVVPTIMGLYRLFRQLFVVDEASSVQVDAGV